MTRVTDDEPGRPAGSAEDAEVAALVRQVAAGWTMPPQGIRERTWRDRVERRRAGRWDRLIAAAAIAASAVAVVALGVAVLDGRGLPDGGPGPASSGAPVGPASPAGTAAPGSGLATPAVPDAATPSPTPVGTTAPATPLPAYVAPAGPMPALSAGALVEDAWRVVDMTTGTASDAIALPDGSGSRLFALADGTYLCACATFEGRDARRIRVVIRRYDALGRPGAELATREFDAGAGADVYAGAPPVSIEPSMSADGRIVAIGWAAWDGASWRSGIDTIDIGGGGVTGGYELPPVPGTLDATVELPARWAAYADSGRRLSVWAPRPWISPDGQTIVTRRILTTGGAAVRLDWFAGTFPPVHAGATPTQFGGIGDATHAPCANGDAGDAGWTAPGVFSIVCSAETSSAVLRFDATGRDVGAVDLSPEAGGGSWPAMEGAAVADVGRGTLYLWEPFTRRLVAVDTVAGRVARSTTIDEGAAGAAGPLDVLAGVVRGFLDAVVPSASAKVYLAPALALSRDGDVLYLLATTAPSMTEGGSGSLGVIVVGADDLSVRARWTPTADLRSIAMSADGRFVLAAGAPGVDATGAAAPREASITAWDAATGEVRAIAGRLGSTWTELVAPLRGP
jgi:hypothetical protein